ncbi:MAG: gliding motility-associated C-terminal domain-containing protein [Bacteroidetes bacterium]|nr:gliding motility-associated C-terminal domain-containing protein [Bacteroidota bacterium]
MKKIILTILFLIGFIAGDVSGQPINDECRKAILIKDVTDFCSDSAVYSNIGSTPSINGFSQCSATNSRDVWFTFFVAATDVIVKVNLLDSQGATATLYSGNCGGLSELVCGNQSNNENFLQIYKGGLTPGQQLYLRIDGINSEEFHFGLCINNFFAPILDGSDCETANLICSKQPFTVRNVQGFGNKNELAGAPCFSNANESNSILFRWICQEPGDFTFRLNPLKEADDIDFVVYKVKGDPMGCDMEIVRCMATGISPGNCASYPNCCGSTGLMAGETDMTEFAGCAPDRNNFLAPLDMKAGEAYVLLVNNYTSQNQGFDFVIGGSAELKGLQVGLDIQKDKEWCRGDNILVKESIQNELSGITDMTWTFVPDASPSSQVGAGPKSITFEKSGIKFISLIVRDSIGCKAFIQDTVYINCCGEGIFVDIGNDTIVEPGSVPDISIHYMLEGEDVSFLWFPPIYVSCDTCRTPEILPIVGDFLLHALVKDENGCQAKDSIWIRTAKVDVFVPNIFSPNNDGINDYFYPNVSKYIIKINRLVVYNRWGSQVFEGRDLDPRVEALGWDGRYKGKELNPDVYTYYIEIGLNRGSRIFYKGSITLIR